MQELSLNPPCFLTFSHLGLLSLEFDNSIVGQKSGLESYGRESRLIQGVHRALKQAYPGT